MTHPDTFAGWPPEAAAFYRGLEADNSKAYWVAHKDVYDRSVLAPMQALLVELAGEYGEGKIFRPNRDIRFSADKSPYKTAIGALLGSGYVQFSAAGLGVGAGYHTMASDQLERYREAVAEEESGIQLLGVLDELGAAGIETSVRDRLVRVPRGYPSDHPHAELLRYKDLAAWKSWPTSEPWIGSPEALAHIIETLHTTRPLVDWLERNVGPTEVSKPRR